MLDKLELLMRFWELRARHAFAGEPLTSAEQVELLSLMQLMTGDVDLPRPGNLSPSSSALKAQLIGDGVIAAAEIRNVSAAGLLVSTHTPAVPLTRFIVKTTDAIGGVEYTLPCKVIWSHGSNPTSLALSVDGVPSCMSFATMPDVARTASNAPPAAAPSFQPSFQMGRHVRLVG